MRTPSDSIRAALVNNVRLWRRVGPTKLHSGPLHWNDGLTPPPRHPSPEGLIHWDLGRSIQHWAGKDATIPRFSWTGVHTCVCRAYHACGGNMRRHLLIDLDIEHAAVCDEDAMYCGAGGPGHGHARGVDRRRCGLLRHGTLAVTREGRHAHDHPAIDFPTPAFCSGYTGADIRAPRSLCGHRR